VVVVVGMAVLVVLAVVAVVVVGDDTDDDGGGGTGGDDRRSSDEVVTAGLLPQAEAFGAGWVEDSRDEGATAAEPVTGDPCPNGPVPDGFLIRAAFAHLADQSIVEQLSITAGVVDPAAESRIPSLADPEVRSCLATQLGELVPGAVGVEPSEVVAPAAPEGAEVSVLRLEVAGESGVTSTFDWVLVRRGRVVALALLTGIDAARATSIDDVVAVLDARLASGARRLG
jgi:hypothetical protein